MDVVVERCAGLDVHRDNVVGTVRVPSEEPTRWVRHTRTFKATPLCQGEVRQILLLDY
jgi:transposase